MPDVPERCPRCGFRLNFSHVRGITEILAPGTRVEWNSQAGGYWKRKVGVVIAYVPAGEDAVEVLMDAGESGRLMGQRWSADNRYIVRVQTGPRTIRYYTPRAGVVRAVSEAGGGENG